MILSLLAGIGVGAGLWLIARGWAPPRPTLSTSLARLRAADIAPVVQPGDNMGFAARVGRPAGALLAQSGLASLTWRGVGRDLTVLGRNPETQLAEKVTLAIVGLLLVPATAVVLALGGVAVPLVVPVWMALVLALIGFFIPDLGVHADAQARRRDFRHALGAFLDLVVVALAGGGGIETALEDAAGVGSGWAFEQLRSALAHARLARETPWSALGRLGDELGIPELTELAASVALAGTEGAKVRSSLAAKAASLRAHELAEAESSAQAATERMSLPVVLLFAGFLVFVGYPAVEHVLTGL